MRNRLALAVSVLALSLVVVLPLIPPLAPPSLSGGGEPGDGAEAKNMRLVGHDDLQGRSAYQPVIHRQGRRWIAYVGHHGGSTFNPMTGMDENNGTSIVDVTDPVQPRYLKHLPGPSGAGEAGGAQMVRICDGRDLPSGDPGATYMLRTHGDIAHQVWDVTNPSDPKLVSTPVANLGGTHKSWWECDTGIAYLVSGLPGWRTNRMTQVFDLSNPAAPRHIRDYGLDGQQPGSAGPIPTGVHGGIRVGNRIYFGHGTSSNGIVQIVDREKLMTGNPAVPVAGRFEPTRDNLLYPQISRLDTPPFMGAHTTYPILQVPVPEFVKEPRLRIRDFLLMVNEASGNECTGTATRQMIFMLDITDETKPFSVASFQVPEASGDFCSRGGRFGAHASHESFTPLFYRKLVFISWFNAGVRVLDVREPYSPREVAFFIPATTALTDPRCVTVAGVDRCKVAIQTNNVEVDDRGFVYLADRANTGLHIVELTGDARRIANLHGEADAED
jgi:hypothetical protein